MLALSLTTLPQPRAVTHTRIIVNEATKQALPSVTPIHVQKNVVFISLSVLSFTSWTKHLHLSTSSYWLFLFFHFSWFQNYWHHFKLFVYIFKTSHKTTLKQNKSVVLQHTFTQKKNQNRNKHFHISHCEYLWEKNKLNSSIVYLGTKYISTYKNY